jgi:hypothetical protein
VRFPRRLAHSFGRIPFDLPSSQSAFFAPSELRPGLRFLGQPYQRWLRTHFRILTASTARPHFTPNLSRKAGDDCSLVSIRSRFAFDSNPSSAGCFTATYPRPRFGDFSIHFSFPYCTSTMPFNFISSLRLSIKPPNHSFVILSTVLLSIMIHRVFLLRRSSAPMPEFVKDVRKCPLW